MLTVNMVEAKTQLATLVESAINGEPFIIAEAGKPMVKVTAVALAEYQPGSVEVALPKRQPMEFGTLAGQIVMPRDFDRYMECEIAEMFGEAV